VDEAAHKPLLDALAPPVRYTGWCVVVTDDDGCTVAVLGPHDEEFEAEACLAVVRLGPGRTGAVVKMRHATAHDVHDQVELAEMGRAASVPASS
jgi:hypothetical protein